MKRIVLAAVAAGLAAGAAAEACTATSTVDRARNARDTDQYRAARDVAVGLIDAEGWRKDADTVDSGTGTLLIEKGMGLSVPNGGTTADDWRSVLDTASERGHGVDVNGYEVKSNKPKKPKEDKNGKKGSGQTATSTAAAPTTVGCSVRDHMRKHIREWHLSGREGDEWAVDPLDATVTTSDPISEPVAAPESAPTPASVSAPRTVDPIPAPPAPSGVEGEPVVDHAG